MPDAVTIERFMRGQWSPIASVALSADSALGIAAATVTAYEIDYAIENLDRRDAAALSAAIPVTLDPLQRKRWPAFLVDLLPQGHGRADLLRQLGLPRDTGRLADWRLLRAGAGNPIGHLRVREAFDSLVAQNAAAPARGFSFEEIAQHSDEFIEFLGRNGLFVLGSSGVQGEWPKLLLTEDAEERLHLDHSLPDDKARRHWLVKFNRGTDPQLARILTLEAPYMKLAAVLGARVQGALQLHQRALFIPRFDRAVSSVGVERIAQESLASISGVSDFGVYLRHGDVVSTLAQVTTDPEAEIIEYVRRDVLNVLLGNRDNHARNTALQRFEDGRIRLSPLYDFAPMMLHPDAIVRLSRWAGEAGSSPDWNRVIDQCREASGLELAGLPVELRQLRSQLEQLPQHAADAGIPADILARQSLSIGAVLDALAVI